MFVPLRIGGNNFRLFLILFSGIGKRDGNDINNYGMIGCHGLYFNLGTVKVGPPKTSIQMECTLHCHLVLLA